MNKLCQCLAILFLLCCNTLMAAQGMIGVEDGPGEPEDPVVGKLCYVLVSESCSETWGGGEEDTCGFDDVVLDDDGDIPVRVCDPDVNGVMSCGTEQSKVFESDSVRKIKSAHEYNPFADGPRNGQTNVTATTYNCERWYTCKCVNDDLYGTGLIMCDTSEEHPDDEDDTSHFEADRRDRCVTGRKLSVDIEPADPPHGP